MAGVRKGIWARDRARGRREGGEPSRVLGLSRALAILFPFSFKRLPDRLVSEP